MGIKFSSEIVCDEINPDSVSDRLIMDCHPREGQLQVHIVEGAGLVDEDTHKAYNTVVKWLVGIFVKGYVPSGNSYYARILAKAKNLLNLVPAKLSFPLFFLEFWCSILPKLVITGSKNH